MSEPTSYEVAPLGAFIPLRIDFESEVFVGVKGLAHQLILRIRRFLERVSPSYLGLTFSGTSIHFEDPVKLTKSQLHLVCTLVYDYLKTYMGWAPYTPCGTEPSRLVVTLVYRKESRDRVERMTLFEVYYRKHDLSDLRSDLSKLSSCPLTSQMLLSSARNNPNLPSSNTR